MVCDSNVERDRGNTLSAKVEARRAQLCRRTILISGHAARLRGAGAGGQVGAVRLQCEEAAAVAILSPGATIVLIAKHPATFQIRNSTSVTLAAQVRIAGGEP